MPRKAPWTRHSVFATVPNHVSLPDRAIPQTYAWFTFGTSPVRHGGGG